MKRHLALISFLLLLPLTACSPSGEVEEETIVDVPQDGIVRLIDYNIRTADTQIKSEMEVRESQEFRNIDKNVEIKVVDVNEQVYCIEGSLKHDPEIVRHRLSNSSVYADGPCNIP